MNDEIKNWDIPAIVAAAVADDPDINPDDLAVSLAEIQAGQYHPHYRNTAQNRPLTEQICRRPRHSSQHPQIMGTGAAQTQWGSGGLAETAGQTS